MLVSIIVPVYNKEKYLHDCIDSVINQTYTRIEIILVDDESTDRSYEICEEYANKDSRIALFRQDNGGAAKARNTGLRYAQGEYIAFIDADDYIDLDYIQTLADLAIKHDADIAQCNRYNSNSNRPADELKETVYEGFEKNGLIYSKLYIPTINPVCKIYRKNLFDNIQFTEGMIYEDECIMHKLLYIANKLVHINKYMYCVVLSPGSVMRSDFSLKRLDIHNALEDRLLFYRQTNQSKLYALTMLRYTLHLKKNSKKMKKSFPKEREKIKELERKFLKYFIKCIISTDLSLRNKAYLIFRLLGIKK